MIGLECFRKTSQMSLRDLAKVLGVSFQYINQWEKGTRPIPENKLDLISQKYDIKKELLTQTVGSKNIQEICLSATKYMVDYWTEREKQYSYEN